jgi:hypothetical protein
MNDKEEIEKAQVNANDPSIDWNIWDVILPVFIVAYVVLEPLGAIDYFCGWYYPNLRLHFACLIFPIVIIFIPLFTGFLTFKLYINWTKYTRKKKIIRLIHVCILLVFILPFLISMFTPINIPVYLPGYKPFTYGFRERIKSKANIEDIRNWMKTLKEENYNGDVIGLSREPNSLKMRWPDLIDWPESLKVFNPHYVNLGLDENGNPRVSLTWGGPFAHWGVVIGMENMKIPPSDLSRYGEYRLPLEPGVYVWHELQ